MPGARRFSTWLDPRWRRVENRIRRLLRRRSRTVLGEVARAGAAALEGRLSGIVSFDPAASIEEKVEWLLRRDREQQEVLNQLSGDLQDLERNSIKRLDDLQAVMQAHVAERLDLAAAAYRPVRILGAVALGVGLALATAGNFVN